MRSPSVNGRPIERPRVPTGETENEKFRRLGTQRVRSIITAFRLIGNLAEYDHTDQEEEKLLATVEAHYLKMRQRFDGASSDEFTL